MKIPVNALYWSLAILPIVVLLMLMVRYRWGAAKAAPVALGIAALTGIILFKAPLFLLLVEAGKGLWNSLAIIIVIIPAILIYEVTQEADAFEPFRLGMQKFSPNELLQVLAIGWVFVSFLQGVTGFGVPVAVGAPLLVGIGVKPIWAVIISLFGQAWGNTFGTLAVAWDALVFQTSYSQSLIQNTALWAASFIWLIDLAAGLYICFVYGGRQGIKAGLPATLIISLIHGGGQLIFSQINSTLANFLPACAALGAIFVLGKTALYNKPFYLDESPVMDRNAKAGSLTERTVRLSLHQAFIPYYALTVITLFVLMVKPVERVLSSFQFGPAFPQTATGFGFINMAVSSYSPIAPFTNAGMFLLLAALIGYLVFRKKGNIAEGGGRRILGRTIQKVLPSAQATIALIVMSKVMAGSGQTEVLAYGTAQATGALYQFFAPFIGLLGSFMTSSNMSSNILFTGFQSTMASLLKLEPSFVLGAQTAGAAIGSVISPSKVLLGTTTTEILGQEGEVIRKAITVTMLLASFIGLAVVFFNLLL